MTALARISAVFIALAATLALSAPARSEAACAEDDFDSFLTEFQNNPSEQENMSADQIEMTTFQEMGSAMPARFTVVQSKEELDWPILPSLAALKQQDLSVQIFQDSPLKAELYARATDLREVDFVWYFEKNPCWSFVGFSDGSLYR
ncbi:hypothetical protein JHL21_03680 [Devosia sp. WQ 349]|uniref:hypothetical protein n=1 Tax=Devosia sp. WQ 349K1 TaxID=2800329 RepID=UPI0019069395|nr:hypothetical protein [Devosia sp. WQ 349K1]MBK1793593.1 hypothetical protein [Devosia sp. WQ 349K1]